MRFSNFYIIILSYLSITEKNTDSKTALFNRQFMDFQYFIHKFIYVSFYEWMVKPVKPEVKTVTNFIANVNGVTYVRKQFSLSPA